MARPPRLPDAAILALIEELRSQHAVLTGTRLREELARRFGLRGGVSRVYRLLDQSQTSPALPPSPALPVPESGTESLRSELEAALERARLAEYREEHHQARWAREIHELREQVRELSDAARRAPRLAADLQDRSRELAAAYRRIADLEAQLP